MPHHNLADFEPCLGYATERQTVGDIPLQNTLESPQYHPQLHLLHSTAVKKTLMTMAGMGELDHLEERLRAIEGGEDYAFAKPRRVVPNTQTWSFPSSRCRTLASIRGLLAPRTI